MYMDMDMVMTLKRHIHAERVGLWQTCQLPRVTRESHGFYTFYSPTAVATVAHGFILAPRFYFHIDSYQ